MHTILYYFFTSGYDDKEVARRLAIVTPLLPDNYKILFKNASSAPDYLDRAEEITSSVKTSAEWISSLTSDDCDVVITGVALDPGLPSLRSNSSVPLVGPGEASLFIASLLGLPTSILVAENQKEAGQQFVDQTISKPEIVSIRSVGITIRTIISDFERGKITLANAARAAIYEDRAQALYLGSMTFPTLGILPELRRNLNVPVYDPLRTAIKAAIEVVEARRLDKNSVDR
jgi:allantoin racemase